MAFRGYLEKHHFLSKKFCGYNLGYFWKSLATFCFIIWSHWTGSDQHLGLLLDNFSYILFHHLITLAMAGASILSLFVFSSFGISCWWKSKGLLSHGGRLQISGTSNTWFRFRKSLLLNILQCWLKWTCIPMYTHTSLPTYLPTYIPTYLPTYLHSYLPT